MKDEININSNTNNSNNLYNSISYKIGNNVYSQNDVINKIFNNISDNNTFTTGNPINYSNKKINISKLNQPLNMVNDKITNNRPTNSFIKNQLVNAETELNKTNDYQNQTIALGLKTASSMKKAFELSQKATPVVEDYIFKGVKTGIKTVYKTKNGISKAFNISKGIDARIFKINGESAKALKMLVRFHAVNSKPVKKILSASNTIKYKYIRTQQNIHSLKQTSKNIVKGNLKVDMNVFVNAGRKTANTVYKTSKSTLKVASKGVNITTNSQHHISSFLDNTDDTGLQSINLGVKGLNTSITGIKTAPKLIKYSYRGIKTVTDTTVKSSRGLYRTGKGIKGAINLVKKTGYKSALKVYANKVGQLIIKNSGSAITTIINIIKALSNKFILPLILIVAVVGAFASILSAPVGTVSALFGGFVTDKNTNEDILENEYLYEEVELKRDDFIVEVENVYNSNLSSNGGEYHTIKLFNIWGSEISSGSEDVNSSISTTEEYVDKIEPIFHSIMITKYGLEPTRVDMYNEFIQLWDNITIFTLTEQPKEYCGGVVQADGNYHAYYDCPNSGGLTYHSHNTGSSCDWNNYDCLGHEEDVSCDGCTLDEDNNLYCPNGGTHVVTNYCSYLTIHSCSNLKTTFNCGGYRVCKGHKLLYIVLGTGSMDDIIQDVFIDEIEYLENKSYLTVDEQNRLNELYENYEFCLDYILHLQENTY